MNASDRAYTELRRDIVEWRLEPGTVLGEVEQSARLGVSRTPLRDALRRLTADGLVEPHPSRGVAVSAVTRGHVDALFEARIALETVTASLAAQRADAELFARLAEEFERAAAQLADASLADASQDRGAYYELIARLDAALSEAADNPYLERAQGPLRANLARLRQATREDSRRLKASALEHASIARAVAARDPQLAAAAARVHLSHARAAIVDALSLADPADSPGPLRLAPMKGTA